MISASAYDHRLAFGIGLRGGRAVLALALFSLFSLDCLNTHASEAEEVATVEVKSAPLVHRIGATAVVTEVTTGLPFPARVDTGATSCSIHCEAMEIEDAAPDAADNVGKPIRFMVKNDAGEEQWIKSKIVDHVTVRTTTDNDERYKVRMKLRWQDIEKRVLVTLSDRDHMKYPLLLGRNFLSGDFIVDVDLDDDE